MPRQKKAGTQEWRPLEMKDLVLSFASSLCSPSGKWILSVAMLSYGVEIRKHQRGSRLLSGQSITTLRT